MTSYFPSRQTVLRYRVYLDAELSRRRTLEQQIEYSTAKKLERTRYEDEYRCLKAAEQMKAQKEYEEYQIRKEAQRKQINLTFIQERLFREQKHREHQLNLEAERRARQLREQELEIQNRIDEQNSIRCAQAFAASRNIEHEKQLRIKEECERENLRIYEEQRQQERLEAELKKIDLQIGSIWDSRELRRRDQLRQLETLDQKSFDLKKTMRASKVKQEALEDSLSKLSKIIV